MHSWSIYIGVHQCMSVYIGTLDICTRKAEPDALLEEHIIHTHSHTHTHTHARGGDPGRDPGGSRPRAHTCPRAITPPHRRHPPTAYPPPTHPPSVSAVTCHVTCQREHINKRKRSTWKRRARESESWAVTCHVTNTCPVTCPGKRHVTPQARRHR
jgi:hypothetical protein